MLKNLLKFSMKQINSAKQKYEEYINQFGEIPPVLQQFIKNIS